LTSEQEKYVECAKYNKNILNDMQRDCLGQVLKARQVTQVNVLLDKDAEVTMPMVRGAAVPVRR
jgi:hypothetical protein